MTPYEFVLALEDIGWSQLELARRLGCDGKMARRWASGEAAIPAPIARWLERLAAFHERWPAPVWRVK